jgi:hypothetical protein
MRFALPDPVDVLVVDFGMSMLLWSVLGVLEPVRTGEGASSFVGLTATFSCVVTASLVARKPFILDFVMKNGNWEAIGGLLAGAVLDVSLPGLMGLEAFCEDGVLS